MDNRRKELFDRMIKESRDRIMQGHHDSAFCVLFDGEFPDDPAKRKAEIFKEYYGIKL